MAAALVETDALLLATISRFVEGAPMSQGRSKSSPAPSSPKSETLEKPASLKKPESPKKSKPPGKSTSPEKSSPTDDFARRIARAISKGRPPSFDDDFDAYCESSPREIFRAFAGLTRHLSPAGVDDGLAAGYLFLLREFLVHLRFGADSGHADAVNLIADFQADVVRKVEAGEIDGNVLALVGGALHQSNIPASPELVAASVAYGADPDEDGDEMLPDDVRAAIGQIFEMCDGDPFMAVGAMFESSHALPPEARGALADELARAGMPAARSATVLLLLDADPAVRRTVAGVLGEVAGALSPADVRRLIAMRNWRPENERAQVDAVIRKARAAGIECAQWPAGGIETATATCIDGSTAQVLLLMSPAERKKKRVSSVLTKGGIADAWSTEPGTRREIEEGVARTRMDVPTLEVSRSYLDRAVAHHLALTIERGDVPPPGLLQVAETIGGADWQPVRINFSKELAGLIADVPKAMREPAAMASMLRTSGEPAGIREIALSWYEDDPEVAQAVKGAHARRAKLASYLLHTVIGRRRERWTDVVLRTALWMREAPPEAGLCWRELALVAKALSEGRDMTEIGLMHDIAVRTITVLRDTGRV
jgi:hypothetical protein